MLTIYPTKRGEWPTRDVFESVGQGSTLLLIAADIRQYERYM
ncbi:MULTISPECIES: hypothetical protein [Yersinia pseudotuberculosis complex]|uniref:Transposase n=2 Tax=Yersinia pestis TaxID=632 RepID=A0AB72ZKT0_YERPE|nr:MULTISPECIES: hypothetical protein [Yersinia pseudotuberculosis complex]ABX86379.1 hypothetical protein YpAngola_A2507 [Yersinia pestis Angola]EDR31854.1 hypothetical protein YPIP275_0723 [Yersinia pestis biovar Orientalis str. IP275]EDR38864.1 hypothetical protein YpF1991016_0722 [Yersinia pestis biovar Orientalis str. F1991016]EDR44223.1 hypothetical protein YpE1979001_0348 [Yersinia pestis biovar Antiqua str. E1979001]EDR52231.1 hypothetical protein YpB42003004_1371 [Yersinia pestis biov